MRRRSDGVIGIMICRSHWWTEFVSGECYEDPPRAKQLPGVFPMTRRNIAMKALVLS